MQVYVLFYALRSLYRLFFHPNSFFCLFYLHQVNVNKETKNYSEFNAPVTLKQGYIEVTRWLSWPESLLRKTCVKCFHCQCHCYQMEPRPRNKKWTLCAFQLKGGSNRSSAGLFLH